MIAQNHWCDIAQDLRQWKRDRQCLNLESQGADECKQVECHFDVFVRRDELNMLAIIYARLLQGSLKLYEAGEAV